MNLTLKDVPAELHEKLRQAAEESGRSLNKLILHSLEQLYGPRKSNRGALLKRIHQRREAMGVWLDDGSLEAAIEEGRE